MSKERMKQTLKKMIKRMRTFWETHKKQILKKDNFLLLILGGILLLVLAIPTEKPKTSQKEVTPGAMQGELFSGGAQAPVSAPDESRSAQVEGEEPGSDPERLYRQELERELTDLLEAIEGVGKVRVMITLKTSQELVTEREEKAEKKSTEETDSAGGRRVVREERTESGVVYSSASQEKSPCVVKTVYPKIEGVVVAATGGGSGRVRTEISEALQALFGIDAHKVKVLKMGNISAQEGIE